MRIALMGVAALASSLHIQSLYAVSIDVPCDAAALAQAFRDVQLAGAGVHEINLAAQCAYTLDAPDPEVFDDASPVALAPVRNQVVVNGQGARIERAQAPGTPAFRIFAVAASAALTLNDLTLRNGLARGERGGDGCTAGGVAGRYGGFGGAVLNLGRLDVRRSWFDGNTAQGGDGGVGFNGGGPGGGGAGIGGAIAQPFSATDEASTEISQSSFTFNRARGGRSLAQRLSPCGGAGFQSAGGGGGGPGGAGGFRPSGTFEGSPASPGQPGGGGGGGGFVMAIGAGGFGAGAGGGAGTPQTAPSGTFGGLPDRNGGFGGGPGGGLGGALFIGRGTLHLVNTTLHANQASGANGEQDGSGASGVGGSIFVQPTVAMNLQFATLIDGRSDGGIALPGPNNRGNGGNGIAGNLFQNPGVGAIASVGSIIAGGVVAAGTGSGTGVGGTTQSPDAQVILESSAFNVYGNTTGFAGVSPSDLVAVDARLSALSTGASGPPFRTPLPNSPVLDRVPLPNCPLGVDQRGLPRPVGVACDTGAIEGFAIELFRDGFE